MLVVTIYKRSIETNGVWNSTNVLSKVTAEFHCCAFLIMFTDENRLTVMYKQMLKWTGTMRLSNKFIQNITLTLNIVLRLNMLLKKSVWATKYTFCYGVAYAFRNVLYINGCCDALQPETKQLQFDLCNDFCDWVNKAIYYTQDLVSKVYNLTI